MATLWSWISRRRQRDVIEQCLRHLDAVFKVVREAQSAVEAYLRGDRGAAEKAYKRLFDAEREADKVKRIIFDELAKGFIHPIDREELVRLTLAIDDIADYTKSGIRRLLYLDPSKAPREVLESYKAITDRLVEAVALAMEAVKSLIEDRERALQLTHRIEALEEEVDEIRTGAEGRILAKCEDYGMATCILSLQVLESLETATDKAEDLADVIRSIALLD